ncbi:MAG TPA: hypothetical protein VD867_08015 [Burkholderiales bacterium]|nr:hypothetical protein [Burkholderiales bacterium]
MPTNVKIIQARDFIRATPGGVLDLRASEALLLDITKASGPLPDVDLLLDARNSMTTLSTSVLWALSQKVAAVGATSRRRTAVLCPAERFDHAQFFSLCGERHGFEIRAFLDYEHAMEWLVADDRAGRRQW